MCFFYQKVAAYNSEGTSNPSEATEFCTCPDRPGAPYRPAVKGKVHANNFKMIWGKFRVKLCSQMRYNDPWKNRPIYDL